MARKKFSKVFMPILHTVLVCVSFYIFIFIIAIVIFHYASYCFPLCSLYSEYIFHWLVVVSLEVLLHITYPTTFFLVGFKFFHTIHSPSG
jgi:hypothetical protein